MEDSIFTKIIKGEIPCHKVYEDDEIFGFLDINPAQPGHTLIVPKKQVEFIWDLDDDTYHALMDVAKKLALRLKEVLGVPYIGEQIIGVDVPHAHLHLIPFSDPATWTKPHHVDNPDHAQMAELAKKISWE